MDDVSKRAGETRPAWQGGEDLGPVIAWLLSFADESSRDRAGIRQELAALRQEVTEVKHNQITKADVSDAVERGLRSGFDGYANDWINRRTGERVWKTVAAVSTAGLVALATTLLLALSEGWIG